MVSGSILIFSLFFTMINFRNTYLPTENSPTSIHTPIPVTKVQVSTTASNFPSTEMVSVKTPTNTPGMGCPSAPPQRVEVGRRGYVCTGYDRLIVRTNPEMSNEEIARIEPNTYFRITGGPICANNWSWWEIKTDADIRGWVSEGGDNIDAYFICPQGLNSP